MNQQTDSVKQALALRLQDTLSPTTKPIVRKHALSDEELANALTDCPSFDESNHDEMTDEQFHQVVRSLSGKVTQSVSKWL